MGIVEDKNDTSLGYNEKRRSGFLKSTVKRILKRRKKVIKEGMVGRTGDIAVSVLGMVV